MSNRIVSHDQDPNANGPQVQAPTPSDEGGLRAPPHYSTLRKIWWWFDFLILVKLARLRFIAILVAVGAVIVYWETLHAHYERWTRPVFGAEQAVSADTEYWCPMHPTIVREKPDKCPICAMPLSKRKKGAGGGEEALPPGILSRVQLTPIRVAQAGVQTTELTYQPLVKEIKTVGFVEFDERKLARITARPTGKSRIDKLYANVTGQMVRKGEPLALLYSPDLVVTVQNLLDARNSGNRDLMRMARDRLTLWGIADDQIDEFLRANGKPITHVTVRSPISGHVIKKYQVEGEYVDEGARLYDVADLSTVWIEAQVYEDEVAFLKEAVKNELPVRATTKSFPSRVFSGKVAFIHPHLDAATRTLRVRFDMDNPDHELRPAMYATVTLEIPATDVVAALPTAQQQAGPQRGLVLAVPERAVIDSGSRKIVYREYLPNEYEGVLVELGPRMAGPDKTTVFYPVVRGLEAGDKLVAAGAFLIDAETRLTSGASSTYFGASGGPAGAERRAAVTAGASLVEDEDAKVRAALGKLSTPDRRLAEAQEFCPVLQDNRLGSMGVPVKVLAKGQPVFLCCAGCKEKALANPDQTLARVEKLKAKTKGGTKEGARSPTPARPALTPEQQAEVKAALAKLSPEDRRLAEAQVFCPVIEKNYLGSMGTPFRVLVKGQPVFLCCDSCQEKALANPDQTLAKVEKLKARAKTDSP